ncbi:type VII secretion system-associated protein [Streptomyces sp. RM72]|uniref:type VII secretion system-associated protein n=1 Tax=Streptomyces sp. RM72 TaxID=1115510 RepID=UPI001B3662B5|nr:type VII secretion system-associated protein [Streptomyces sp. RM72]MBQ0891076.1 type VII secretion system-associated protein [Streptomyces sp. RM72]
MPTNLTSLDPTAMQSFIDNEIGEYKTALRNLRTSNGDRKSLFDVAHATTPLTIGNMAGDDETGGKKIVTNMVNAAKAVDGVLNAHVTMVDDLERSLRETIAKMQKAQQHNLDEVTAEAFLLELGGTETALNGGKTPTPPATTP